MTLIAFVFGCLWLLALLVIAGAIFELAKAVRAGQEPDADHAAMMRQAVENQQVALEESRKHITGCKEHHEMWNAVLTHWDTEMRAHIKWCTERWGDGNEPASLVQ